MSSVTFVRLACASCVHRLSPPEAIHPIGTEAEAQGTVVMAASLSSLFMAAFTLSVMTTDDDPPTETRTLLHNTGRTKLCCVGRIRFSAGPGLDQQRGTSAGRLCTTRRLVGSPPQAATWLLLAAIRSAHHPPRGAPTELLSLIYRDACHLHQPGSGRPAVSTVIGAASSTTDDVPFRGSPPQYSMTGV